MTLGEKIKQARLEAGLSQRQLCGEEVTRNMLSQIENGTARPSMARLAYFAARLGKPVSFFLEEELLISPNQAALNKARQALSEGKAAYAVELLEQMEVGNEPWLQRERLLLLGRAAPRRCVEICAQLPSLDEELMLRAQAALEGGDFDRCAVLLEAAQEKSGSRWNFLRGRCLLGQGDFAAAAKCLHRAEDDMAARCEPLLEQCYRQLGDFKMAYEYACKQRGDL